MKIVECKRVGKVFMKNDFNPNDEVLKIRVVWEK